MGGRALQCGQQRQQNKNRPRVNNLPVEMVPICLMGAHARGRVSYAFSLTSWAKFAARRFPGCNGSDTRLTLDRRATLFPLLCSRFENSEIEIYSRQRTSKSPISFPSRKRITKAL